MVPSGPDGENGPRPSKAGPYRKDDRLRLRASARAEGLLSNIGSVYKAVEFALLLLGAADTIETAVLASHTRRGSEKDMFAGGVVTTLRF